MKRQLLFLACVLAVLLLPHSMLGESKPTRSELVGKWTGKISSRNYASFVVTIDIGPDSKAHVVGDGSPCFSEANLVVTTSSSNAVTLAGSSQAGESITFKGTVDGKQLDLTYIANGSSSARCETDQGAGTLEKQ